MNKAAASLVMIAGQRESLAVLARPPSGAHREVQRAKMLLTAADGVAQLPDRRERWRYPRRGGNGSLRRGCQARDGA